MLPAPSRLIARLAAALVLAGTAACDGGDAETGLLNNLAARLDRAGELTFTAEYRLGDGSTAVLAQAQQPRRAAYLYAGGRSVSTETQLATCQTGSGGSRCTLTAPPSPGNEPALDLLATVAADGVLTASPSAGTGSPAGMVTPAAALRLVSAAVRDGATVTRLDNTIAGEPATCVGVHGSTGFTTCVTESGLLGSFTGTVNGSVVTFELTSFTSDVKPDVFALPPGATVDDRRAR
jgi:hypothetical protein